MRAGLSNKKQVARADGGMVGEWDDELTVRAGGAALGIEIEAPACGFLGRTAAARCQKWRQIGHPENEEDRSSPETFKNSVR